MLSAMLVAGVVSRERFRAFPLDGALLFFQPATGRSLRVENARTRHLRRHAPRVVMFGITNRCNLRCSFCSRDTARDSAWTVETAAQTLRDLSAAGTLEVAFGGGEPFTFRGFAELLTELRQTTPLALHVTSNGTLLDRHGFAPFRGLLGQVRISIYDDERWLIAAQTLSEARQLWGANLLIDDARLAHLPALLAQLAALGCHDVSLLSYVGAAASLGLTGAGRTRLAQLLEDAPLPCRLSVCLGDGVPAPRLFAGADGTGDCGAGYDFVSITPDQQLQSCSFQDWSLPARSAQEILTLWRDRRAALREPSQRRGCARALPLRRERAADAPPPLALWRAFSGNNSGECILVGKFESNAAAERYLEELRPGWAPDGEYSDEWQQLFTDENVVLAADRESGELRGQSPSALVAIGSTVLATSYDAGDAFPELRALTWKRGGFVVRGGIHLHESPALLAAIRGREPADAAQLIAGAKLPEGWRAYQHGEVAFVLVPSATKGEDDALPACAQRLKSLAGTRPLSAELVLDQWDETEFLAAKQRLGVELSCSPRLQVIFWHGWESAAHAARFAQALNEANTYVVGGHVLVDGLSRRKRAAVLALRQGASVSALDGRELKVQGSFWFNEPPVSKGQKGQKAPKQQPRVIDAEKLARELSGRLHQNVLVEAAPSYRNGVVARVTSSEPPRALTALLEASRQLGAELNTWLSDIEPYGFLLRRLLADLRQ
jgi:hypothetical protein